MKLVFCDESDLILFLNNLSIQQINFEDREELEDYFKKLFIKLNDSYKITINGYYQIDIYLDPYYGAIIEIQKEELDYFEYDDNQVDMRICIHQMPILYELEEYIHLDKNLYDMIWYHNKWYVKLKKKIDSIHLGRLLEYATIHYENDTEQIIRRGTYLNS